MELANITNTTTIADIVTSYCGLQTAGALSMLVLFGLSEAMPFLGDSKKNNGIIQTIIKVLLSLIKSAYTKKEEEPVDSQA